MNCKKKQSGIDFLPPESGKVFSVKGIVLWPVEGDFRMGVFLILYGVHYNYAHVAGICVMLNASRRNSICCRGKMGRLNAEKNRHVSMMLGSFGFPGECR